MMLFLASLLAGLEPSAQLAPSVRPDACLSAMAATWPKLVANAAKAPSLAGDRMLTIELVKARAPRSILPVEKNGPIDDQKSFERLSALCAANEKVLQDLVSLQAETDVYLNPKEAIALLGRHKIDIKSKLFAKNLWLKQAAQFMLNDQQGYLTARAALVEANQTALLATQNWELVESASSKRVAYRVYQPKGARSVWMFVVSPMGGEQITTVIAAQNAEYSTPEKPYFELRHIDCNSEGAISSSPFENNPNPPYSAVRDQVTGYFDGSVAPNQNDVYGPFSPMVPNCLLTGKIFPALGEIYQFDGTEYVDGAAPLTSEIVAIWINSNDTKKRDAAVSYVMAHPDAVEPFTYIQVISLLLEHGNNQQAAFWYYVYQIRSAPWRRADPDPSGSGALYASLAATLGQSINEWAGSDLDAMRELMLRAGAFERKAPLYPIRPFGVSKAKWLSLIAETRNARSDDSVRKDFANKDQSEIERRKNGLYVGPWKSPGQPLPEGWR